MAGKKSTGFVNSIPPEKLDENGNYILSSEEKENIRDAWNVKKIIDLKPLVLHIWNEPELDGRSKQAQALKRFLAEAHNAAPIAAQTYVPQTEKEILTEDDKTFIKNHASELKPKDIARKRWGSEVGHTDVRYKLCLEYYDSLPIELLNPKYIMETKEYNPPKTPTQLIARLRDYRICDWEEARLSNKEKECVRRTIKYCATYRYVAEVNSLMLRKEREYVESQYLKCIYDKENLTEEECDMYISLGMSYLSTFRMREEEMKLIRIRDEQLETSEAEGKPTVNLALAESINELRKELSLRESKQEATIGKLNGTREERMKKSGTGQATMTVFFMAWKEKDKRDKLLLLAEKRKEALSGEIERLTTIDSTKFEIWGVTKGELVN